MGDSTASFSMQSASSAMSVGSAVMGAFGAYGSAKATKSSLKAQAQIDMINARQAEMNYQHAADAGQREVGRVQMHTAQVKGAQRARLAANGVDLGTGSAAEILTSTDVLGEIDANTMETNAVHQAWGYRTQKTNFENDALFKRAGASAISPFGAALTSLMGSGGQVAKSWYSHSQSTPSKPAEEEADASQMWRFN